MQNQKMEFAIKGFSQVEGSRVFLFEGISPDWGRTAFTVRADLVLARRYGIRLQELPLLCRTVLERRPEGQQQREFVFTEEDMCRCAARAAALAEEAKRKRKPRPPATSQQGSTWRAPWR